MGAAVAMAAARVGHCGRGVPARGQTRTTSFWVSTGESVTGTILATLISFLNVVCPVTLVYPNLD